jgi:hypothetical protein
MFYALKITDNEGYIVCEHVSNTPEDVVHTEYTADLPHSTWKSSNDLVNYVRSNRPNWEIHQRKPLYTEIFASKI